MQAQSHSGSSDSGRLPTEQWQGQEVAFMRSNEHSKDRRGSWHPEGLEGAALHLVQGDEKNGRCFPIHSFVVYIFLLSCRLYVRPGLLPV